MKYKQPNILLMKILLSFICLITCFSNTTIANDKKMPTCEKELKIRSFKPSYASGFSIDYFRDFKIVKSHFNKDEFIIANNKLHCKTKLFVFKADPKSVAATSTTHLFIFKEFNLYSRLKGFQGKKYISDQRVNLKKVIELNHLLDKEELIALNADLVIAYSGNFKSDKMIFEYRKLNIPVVLNYDYIETHPLARLEWMIFNSAFFNLEDKAQILFLEKSKKYLSAMEDYKNTKKIKVLVGDIQDGKWATPGRKSNLGVLISDAGGDLVLKNMSEKTQFYNIESVIGVNDKIDVWLTHNYWRDKKILNKDERYKLFKDLRVFNNNKKTNSFGYNDFWEDAQNYPEILIVELHHLFNQKPILQKWYQELK